MHNMYHVIWCVYTVLKGEGDSQGETRDGTGV